MEELTYLLIIDREVMCLLLENQNCKLKNNSENLLEGRIDSCMAHDTQESSFLMLQVHGALLNSPSCLSWKEFCS